MTAPMEFEEPEPIPSSHLVRTQCRTCGRPAQCDPRALSTARCAGCLGSGAVFAPGEIPHYHPGGWKTWGPAEVRERAPHPAPGEVGKWTDAGVTMALPFELPAPVRGLAEVAVGAGWQVRMRYARGYGIHATQGRPTSLVHSLAVACRLCGRQAFAVYERPVKDAGEWAWRTVWLLDTGRPPFGIASIGELTEWLKAGGEVPEEWYGRVRDRVSGLDTARRDRERMRKEIRKAHAEGMAELARGRGMTEEEVRKAHAKVVAELARSRGMTEEEIIKIVTVRAAGKRKEVGG